MVVPNMATMLCFLTTDAAIAPEVLKTALSSVVENTFNMLSVDGDTSTNDMVSVLANGKAGNAMVTKAEGADYESFHEALDMVCRRLCQIMAKDGEGATKLLTCVVEGAPTLPVAKTVAKSVVKSTLLKAAIFGADANWGRVLCAIGYSGAELDVSLIDVDFQSSAGSCPFAAAARGFPSAKKKPKGNPHRGRNYPHRESSQRFLRRDRMGLRPDIRLCENQRRLSNLRKTTNLASGKEGSL